MAFRIRTSANPEAGWRLVLTMGLGIFLLACKAPVADQVSLRKAWLQAPTVGILPWNREKQLDRMVTGRDLTGMTRAQILELFGQPGYSQVDYPGATRMEEYRLSSGNQTAFRVDYDRSGKVTEDSIDGSPCQCPACQADAPLLTETALDKSGLLQMEGGGPGLTLEEAAKRLGLPGHRSSMQTTAGGQVWLRYSETWRMDGSSNSYFVVDGGVPYRNAHLNDLDKEPVESWAIVAFAPDCLAQ